MFLLKKSQNVKCLAFFGKIFGVIQNAKFQQNFWNSSQIFFCLRVLKTFKNWIFWKKRWFFLKKTWFFENRQLWQSFYELHFELYFCWRVLKTLKTGFSSAEKDSLAKFQKQWTRLSSSRTCTKSFYCPRILKLSEFGLFWKNKQITWKRRFKTFENFNFASFFSNTSRTLPLLMCFEDIQNFRFFGKRNSLFFKRTLESFQKH